VIVSWIDVEAALSRIPHSPETEMNPLAISVIAAGLAAAAIGAQAQAATIDVTFSGVAVQTALEIEYPTIWGVDAYGQNIIGDPYTATFTYDTSAGTTTLIGSPASGEYDNAQAVTAGFGTFTIGDHTYTVQNGYHGEEFQSTYDRSTGGILMELCSIGSCYAGDYFELGTTMLIDPSLNASLTLTTDQIVGGIGNVVLSGPNGGELYGDYSVDSVTIAAVPEPATWAMMIIGFGGAGAAMRRLRAKRSASAAAS
jgi:PEP-CTERM motif